MSLNQPQLQRLTADEARTLLALDEQFAETRRGSTTMIVLAACNARDAADQDRVMVALAGLRRRHLVNLRGDRWMPTPEGIEAARQQRAAKPGRKRKPEPLPRDLLHRCAAMQLTLLADARRRYEQGDPEAAGEIRWLTETGRQLLSVGGLS